MFVFENYSAPILAGLPDNVTETFSGFPQSLQGYGWAVIYKSSDSTNTCKGKRSSFGNDSNPKSVLGQFASGKKQKHCATPFKLIVS
jgi:hypothetical protein